MAEKSVSQMLKETLFYDPKPATVRLSDEELVTLTFKIQPSVLARVDAAARHAGITRSAFLRRAVEHELAVA